MKNIYPTRTMLRFAPAAILIAAAAIACGCAKHADPIVGKWGLSRPFGNSGRTMNITFDFKADHTGTQTLELGPRPIVLQYNYTDTSGVLTQTNTGVVANGKSLPVPNTAPPTTYNYTVSGATLALTPAKGGTLNLTRQN